MLIRKVVPFEAWHLDWLEQAGLPEGGWIALSREQRKELEGHANWTAVVGEEIICCGGTVEIWPGRHSAWAYLNKSSAPHMLFVTRAARVALAKVKGRIEMTVRIGFDEGRRWAFLLGFHVETPHLSAYGPQGEAHTGFVRFN
jgi:hypothetical protein